MINQTAGTNANEIITEIDKYLDELKETLPEDMEIVELMSTKNFLDASIDEVIKTLLEAIVLVVLVVYVFLQNPRSTLIPTISIFVSLIGTFAALYIAGFSINLLTLFALVLAICTIVDDAIIVVEAVQVRFDEGYRSPYKASVDAMTGISSAIVTSTLEVWKEQVRTMEARMKVGEETENAVTQARASLYELEATHNDLLRQQRETENSLCTLLGMTSRSLERGTLDKQIFPETLPTGIPVRLLSRRPDIVQAEMTLANAYYTTNQARSAFYPNLNLSGSAGWTNALGQAVTNPGDWILSAVASLTQPLFNRGKLISNLRVSKDEEQIALLNYRQALLDAGQEVNDALYATESAGRSLESHRKQCRELERTVQTSEALYRTDNATYLELLTARQSLLNARLNVVTDSFTQCQAVINLYQALGGGAE